MEENNLEKSKQFLRRLRNDIVGSVENKIEYMKNSSIKDLLNGFLDIKDINDSEYLKLYFSVINSFVITHSNEMDIVGQISNQLTNKSIKLLLGKNKFDDVFFVESCLRFLKSLALKNLLSIEDCHYCGIISKFDEFLINDICYEYISVILEKISDSSYYRQLFLNNTNLVEKYISKFLENENKKLVIFVLKIIDIITDSDSIICNRLHNQSSFDLLTKYIRYYDNEIKIISLDVLTNILFKCDNQITKSKTVNHIPIIWGLHILTNLLPDLKSYKMKINSIRIMTIILNNDKNYQNHFYNIEGIEILSKELKTLFPEEKIKEIDDKIKQLKSNKNSSFFKEIHNSNLDAEFDEKRDYKISLIEALAASSSQKEESRKKIIDSKEFNIMISLLDSQSIKLVQAASNLILSLSRSQISIKKFLIEIDITGILFKLSESTNIDLQISVTNSLCNFLLDTQNNSSEINECITKLLKIYNNTKHNKIRYNVICAIKNILFYSNNNKEIKKTIMKKLTYDTLINLIDDEEITIQEQALLIFRCLLFKNSEDVEEVLSNCKTKLLKKLEEKLNSSNEEIIVHSLYVIANMAAGSDKHKTIVINTFIKVINDLLDLKNPKIRNQGINIILKLLSNDEPGNDTRLGILNEYGIIGKLESLTKEDLEEEIKNNISTIFKLASSIENKTNRTDNSK